MESSGICIAKLMYCTDTDTQYNTLEYRITKYYHPLAVVTTCHENIPCYFSYSNLASLATTHLQWAIKTILLCLIHQM